MKKLSFIIMMLLISMTMKSQYSMTTLKFSETQHDFGVFKEVAGRQTYNFIVTITGNQPLVFQKVTASCVCTAVHQENHGFGVKPGESSSIKTLFSSGSYKGNVTKMIYVYTNDPNNSEAVLMLNAEVD